MIYAFDDMTVGQHFDCGDYAVTREEILEFAQKYDPQPIHVNEAAAAKTMYGSLIASGWHTCGIAMRLMCDSFLNQSTGIGSPGIDEIRFLRPVRPGDVLRVSFDILETTPSRSKPDRGSIRHKTFVMNQKDEMVLTMVAITMMRRRQMPD